MSQTFQAPTLPALTLVIERVKGLLRARARRRIETEAVQHLRQFDNHLLADIDVDAEALWQPAPCLRLLHAPFAMGSLQRDHSPGRI